MDETRFRALMRDALGDEPMRPWLSEAVRSRVAQPEDAHTGRARWILIIAAVLVALVVSLVLAPRLFTRPVAFVPGATPPFGALNCTLPVLVGAGSPGYVNTNTGRFTPDTTSTAGMPTDYQQTVSFDPTYKHLVPVPPSQVS